MLPPAGELMGSSSLAVIKDWANTRKLIIERDDYMCRICRKDGADANLNVHHVDYIRTHNEPDNLVTLCRVCHMAVHRERYKPFLYEDWPIPWGKHPEEDDWMNA